MPDLANLLDGAVESMEDVILGKCPKANSNQDRFDQIIGELEQVLMDDSFLNMQQDFYERHAQEFDETTEENKLLYTELFHNYTEMVEQYLEKTLKQVLPWFTMTEFMEMLSSQQKEHDAMMEGDVFDMLLTLGDFTQFKEMMLDYKKAKNGMGFNLDGILQVTHQQ